MNEELTTLCETFGKCKWFTEYQLRVAGQVDLYPTRQRYHIITTGKRGTYTMYDLHELLAEHIIRQDAAEKQAQRDEWKEIEGRPFVYIDLLAGLR